MAEYTLEEMWGAFIAGQVRSKGDPGRWWEQPEVRELSEPLPMEQEQPVSWFTVMLAIIAVALCIIGGM